MATHRSMPYGVVLSLLVILVHYASHLTEASPSEDIRLPACELDAFNSFSDFLACVGHRRSKRYTNNHNHRYLHREDYGHPCHAYVELNQPERRIANRVSNPGAPMLCDRNLRRRWYRFSGAAGGVMPEMCVEEFSCGTHSPIWLNGQHPTRHGEIVDREVCASLSGKCCSRRWYIRVANCGDFYSYLLTDSPGCFMAYCAGNEMPCPPGHSSPTGFFPGCSDNFPTLSGNATLRLSSDDSSVKFFCDYEGTIARDTVIDVDWFVQGDKRDHRRYGDVPVWTDEMIERRRSVLTEGYWEGKLGSSIFCRMRARWRDEQGVQSPPIDSEKYFAGIKILRRVVNVSESGPEGVIQIRSTIPVSCLPQFKDSCKVSVEVAHDSNWQEKQCVSGKMRQVVFGDCYIELTPSNWNQTHNITVKAVRDFYNDGNRAMRVGFKPIFTTFASDFWNDYRLPDVEVIANDSPAQMCSSTGDPHYTTFDGLYYHVYLEGEFVLYKNTRYPLQINTRLEQCGKVVSCNCGVAVMADDDVIVIDRCRRQKKNTAEGKSFPDGWNTIHRHALEQGDSFIDGLKLYEHDDGRRYTIQLPTGAYVDFHVGENWINVFLHGSSDDWKQTLGLCGTFDGNQANDFLFPDQRTQTTPRAHDACGNSTDVCNFAESWRVPDSQSLFKDTVHPPALNGRRRPFVNNRYCKCEDRSGQSTVVCNYHYDHQNCEQEEELDNAIETTNNVKFRSRHRRMKRSSSFEDESEGYLDQGFDDYFDSDFVYDLNFKGQEPRWPTPSGITERYARDRCYQTLVQSSIGTTCFQHVYDDINKVIDACMVDVKVTDSFNWLQSSLDTMVSRCINRIHDDASLWQLTQPHPTSAPSNLTRHSTTAPTTRHPTHTRGEKLLDKVCPSACSQKGHCARRKCHCVSGYTGVDCSVPISVSPQITFLSDGALCDVQLRPCHKIAVYGKNFRHSSPIQCQFREASNENHVRTTTAVFETFEEVICPMPEHGVGERRLHHAYRLSLQQNGRQSEEHLLVVFDSKCQHCEIQTQMFSCSLKENSCSINGRCYGNGEKNPDNCCQVCNASQATTYFVAATGLVDPVLQPAASHHEVRVGQFWLQTISAAGSCRAAYRVLSHADRRGLEFAVGDNGVHFSVTSAETRVYAFEVKATDLCSSVTTSKNFSVAFVDGPTTTINPLCVEALETRSGGSGEPYRQQPLPLLLVTFMTCLMLIEDNRGRWISFILSLFAVTLRCCYASSDTPPPTVAATSLDLAAVQGQLMTFPIEAGHPVQGQTLSYYVLKNTNSYVSMTQSGLLKYVAPSEDSLEQMTVIIEDTCGQKAFVTVNIEAVTCACRNNGTCVFEPHQQPGGGQLPMICWCLDGYRGNNCELTL